jgi:hypothetical protein
LRGFVDEVQYLAKNSWRVMLIYDVYHNDGIAWRDEERNYEEAKGHTTESLLPG